MFGKSQEDIHIAPQAVDNRTDVLSPARARLWLVGLGLLLLCNVFGAGLLLGGWLAPGGWLAR